MTLAARLPDFGQCCLLYYLVGCPRPRYQPASVRMRSMNCLDGPLQGSFDFTRLRIAGPRIFDFCSDLGKGHLAILDLAHRRAGGGAGSETGLSRRRRRSYRGDARPGEKAVRGASLSWALDDARTARLNRRFDLMLLTGHAFQVFLTHDDEAAALTTIDLPRAQKVASYLMRAAPLPKPGRHGRPINRGGSSSTRG